jgi:protein-S-isoprenylcysteine O-methyltransferase Ste14
MRLMEPSDAHSDKTDGRDTHDSPCGRSLVTVGLYELARDSLYFIAFGAVAAVLLAVGAIVGIRRGT